MRATEACGSKDNTEYFLSGEATTLNTSWMEQNPRHALAALEKWSCRRQPDIGVRVLADVDVTLQEEYLCRDPNAVVLKLGRNNTLVTKRWLKHSYRALSLW